jgi:uncharacterized protein YrrD
MTIEQLRKEIGVKGNGIHGFLEIEVVENGFEYDESGNEHEVEAKRLGTIKDVSFDEKADKIIFTI